MGMRSCRHSVCLGARDVGRVRGGVATLVGLFGAQRCMFASDLRVESLAWVRLAVRALLDEVAPPSKEERSEVLAGSARRFYRRVSPALSGEVPRQVSRTGARRCR